MNAYCLCAVVGKPVRILLSDYLDESVESISMVSKNLQVMIVQLPKGHVTPNVKYS